MCGLDFTSMYMAGLWQNKAQDTGSRQGQCFHLVTGLDLHHGIDPSRVFAFWEGICISEESTLSQRCCGVSYVVLTSY